MGIPGRLQFTKSLTPEETRLEDGQPISRPDTELEAELAAAIEPWLRHMTWRPDFEQWRERRIWQENYQQGNLRDVRAALGSDVAGKIALDLGAGMGGLSVALLRE